MQGTAMVVRHLPWEKIWLFCVFQKSAHIYSSTFRYYLQPTQILHSADINPLTAPWLCHMYDFCMPRHLLFPQPELPSLSKFPPLMHSHSCESHFPSVSAFQSTQTTTTPSCVCLPYVYYTLHCCMWHVSLSQFVFRYISLISLWVSPNKTCVLPNIVSLVTGTVPGAQKVFHKNFWMKQKYSWPKEWITI